MKNFYEIMQEQAKIENGLTVKDMDYIRDNMPLGTLQLTWLTTSVYLAIEMNNVYHKNYDMHYRFKDEAMAMMTAYYRAGYYTAEEFVNFVETFLHLMRVNYRAKKPYKRINK